MYINKKGMMIYTCYEFDNRIKANYDLIRLQKEKSLPFFINRIHFIQKCYHHYAIDGKINMLGTDARKLKDSRYQGWFAGAGIAYGYAWILGRHWNLEAELGFGYSFTKYDRFRCAGCGKKVETDKTHHYIGPTKLAINLVYVF